jgi:uncharacterized membrane protein
MFSRAPGVPRNERIIGLSDAVFGIVITLLVLELKVPTVPAEELGHKLGEMLPEILSHAGSFVVLGIYWVGHHNMFFHIQRHDRVLLWLNILFLMLVSSMPFPTGLVVSYLDSQLPVIIFAGVLVAAGLVQALMWWYATSYRHLVDENMSSELVSRVHRRILMAPAIYLIAIGVSFFSILAVKIIFVLVLLVYIVPNPLDHVHHRELQAKEED